MLSLSMAKTKVKKTVANIKIESITIEELKKFTKQATGQRAVEKALIYFMREARQRDLIKFLSGQRFATDFDPLSLRSNDR